MRAHTWAAGKIDEGWTAPLRWEVGYCQTMPLYEYECESCGHRFERIQKFSDKLVSTCPSCGGRVKKLLSPPAIQFKGSGWYVTDYARKPTDKKAASSVNTTSEKKPKDAQGSKDSTDTSTSKSRDRHE